MASRQLRKLRQQQELLNLQKEAEDRSEESEDEPIVAKPRGNMFSGFAALGGMGDDEDGDEDDEQKSEAEGGEDAHEEQAKGQAKEQATAEAEPVKKSKKKSKKKKKKGKQAGPPEPAADGQESMDEIDKVLEELKLEAQRQGGPGATSAAGRSTNALDELLRINLQHLKAMNEMRRLFGKAMDVAEVEERTQDNRQRGLPENVDLETFLSARAAHFGRGPQASKSMFDTVLRTNPFIEGKKTWPRGTAQGLKMLRITQGQQEEVEFAFAHDSAYDALEGSFFGLVQMYDPMQIVYFLHRHPYHVSSLIQVSKVARQDQNSALAADLIERALFTFGRASLSEFRRKLEKGQARMSFARPENRQFYLAGYNLIQKLVMKGTYRTALEWAKLFLSINHDDPYAMVHWIHVLAIRARESQWFVDFCRSDLFGTNLNGNIYPRQTLPLAHLQLKDRDTAKAVLVEGIETLPWLYCSLFQALGLDAPKSVWAVQPRDDDELLHTELYLHMAKELWNTPQHISLLKEAAAAAAPPSAASLPPSPRVTLATARFVYLDNTPPLMAAVPRQMLHTAAPNFEFDPLPPPAEDNIFSTATQKLAWMTTASDRAAATGLDGGARRAEVQAAMARLRNEIEREVVEERARRGREGDGAAEAGEPAAQETGQPAQTEPQPPRERPAPGIMNYLRYLLEDRLEVVDQLQEFEMPTGMPGAWGQGEGWDEDDFEGPDDFEGVDDFEGGGDFVPEEEERRGETERQ